MSGVVSVRFAARLAIAFAAFLALAEVVRNWGEWGFWPFWLVDYIAVALLVVGARASSRSGYAASAPLSGAWGFTCAMFYMSFFSHLETLLSSPSTRAPAFLPEKSLTVAIGGLFAVTIVGFLMSLRPPGRHAG